MSEGEGLGHRQHGDEPVLVGPHGPSRHAVGDRDVYLRLGRCQHLGVAVQGCGRFPELSAPGRLELGEHGAGLGAELGLARGRARRAGGEHQGGGVASSNAVGELGQAGLGVLDDVGGGAVGAHGRVPLGSAGGRIRLRGERWGGSGADRSAGIG